MYDILNTKSKRNKVYFWEKSASQPENDFEDKIIFHEIEDDSNIRGVIRNFESRIISEKLLFSNISPKNPSVKKWINNLMNTFPDKNEDVVEDLLNTFRTTLYNRSKERGKVIVGLLLMRDILLLVHCKKDPSLAEMNDEIYSANLILHPNNVRRTAIIKKEDQGTTFSAFEHSRKWSKGHAEFWNIEPENVSWESLGSILLNIEVESFPYPIQLPIEIEDLDRMIKDNEIPTTGKIKIGKEIGNIIEVNIFKKSMGFPEFYDFYVTYKEKLNEHKKKYGELVFPQALQNYEKNLETYQYEDDITKLFEIATEGKKLIHGKSHPRFIICFFTRDYPGIKPTHKLIHKLYQSIFENRSLDVWHAGEETSDNSIKIGNLNIHNRININKDTYDFSDKLLNIIQDAESRKKKAIIQYYFCEFWKKNLDNKNIKYMFDCIQKNIVSELEFEFKNDGLLDTEEILEFKSVSDVNPKPTKFVNEILIPTIKKYTETGKLSRLCILYGIEDNGEIKPIYHLKSDQVIPYIEEAANKKFLSENIQIAAHVIPFREGSILSVLIIPKITN
jgi:hypothetical protein